MAFYKFFSFVRILKESIQLIPKNGKIMGLITIFYLLFTSIFFLFFKFTSDSLFRDMFIKESFIPISSINGSSLSNLLFSIKQDFKLVLAIDLSFFFSYLFISIFSTNTIILISSISYYNKTLNVKDLAIKIFRSCKRLIFTMFYTRIIVIGYFFFCFSMATPFLATSHLYDFSTIIIFAIFAYIFYLYLSVVWVMALVVSIVEEGNYGVKALGKAGKIIKGNEMKGFILNIVFNLLALIIFLVTQIIIKKWSVNKKNSMLILVNGSCLLKVFELVNYIVLYFHSSRVIMLGTVEMVVVVGLKAKLLMANKFKEVANAPTVSMYYKRGKKLK
ncbi:uncharacterized protein LOC129893002 [Solanum dulcamara]|uniref:uncharacterized protein LOC129893002 n=1 Tax=Solanum dulcamara TaxID=45834 RepID=UPI002486BBC8|nr:uncharacterized protein LOC129893002 [Solanum dulcamara]